MQPQVSEPSVPQLALSHCSVEEYCLSLRGQRGAGFWWYQEPSDPSHNYSHPFQDADGAWWYQVKRGLAWPADTLQPLQRPRLPFSKCFLGHQHLVADAKDGDSFLAFNVLENLSQYSLAALRDKRRAVRKGLRLCSVIKLDRCDEGVVTECAAVWNSLVERTGWKMKLTPQAFVESWRKLLVLAGTSILVGTDKEQGGVAGFLIVKIFGSTAYVDTIASHSDKLALHINDALLYSFLMNAQQVTGVTRAHYSLVSNVTELERFKQSLGFVPTKFPACTHLTPGVGTALRLFFPQKFKRLVGDIGLP